MVMESKEFQRSFSHSDTERLSRSDEVLKLKNFKKDAALKPFKSTNQERSVETKFPAIAFNDELSSKTLSREPTVSSLNDKIDFRVSFDDSDDEDDTNEFPAIFYNDAQTSKSDLLTEPILSPQHVDEFDLNDETSLSEYDEEEQNVLYFNDLFPFDIIHPDDLK
ncbi:hypothetical protein Tco_1533855 [Tanacetum coccineum]